MIMYKDKSVSDNVCEPIAHAIAQITDSLLDAKIELRIVETIFAFNANEVHIEMRFRDFGEWSDRQLEDYHKKIMASLGDILKEHHISCSYSFYIIPSVPPRSIWSQDKV
jgi:hypothetical protein